MEGVRGLTDADELSDWEDRLEALAARADRLLKAEATAGVALQPRVALAKDAFQVLFLAVTPQVIAASCRLTVLVSEPVLAGVPPLDEQLLEARKRRLDGVLAEALGEGTGAPADAPAGEPEDAPALEHPSPTPEPPAAAPRRQLRPAAERMRRREPEQPTVEPEQVQQLPAWLTSEPGELEHQALDAAEVEPGDHQADELVDGWLEAAAIADALQVRVGTFRAWVHRGAIPAAAMRRDMETGRRLFLLSACRAAAETHSRVVRRRDPDFLQKRKERVAAQARVRRAAMKALRADQPAC